MNQGVDPSHLIEEMRHDVRAGDVRKAALVLAHLNSVDEDSRLAILSALAEGEPRMALPLLASVLAEDPMMEFTFPEVRLWLGQLAAASPYDFVRALNESAGAVRAVLVSTVAEIGMEEAQEVLLTLLNQERNPSVISAVLEALGEVGGEESVVSVAEFLYAEDDEMFSAAARALARIGTPGAVEQLKNRAGRHPHLDELLVGVLWEVQTPEALRSIVSMLASPFAPVRASAMQALRMSGGRAVPLLLDNLLLDDDDVLVHSLEILGEIGDPAAYRNVRQLLSRHPESANVRFAAYEALGKLPMQGRGFALAAGLEDQVEAVRVAAAGAIERNLDPALLAGVRNLLDSGEGLAASVARAATEARAFNLASSLAATDNRFRGALVEYLCVKAHPETRARFAGEFARAGLAELSALVAPAEGERSAARRRVFAVDDSQMILRIYKAALHQLGFDPVVFPNPVEAVAAALADPPAALFTDLNMPEITGVELIRRIRAKVGKDRLPIAMVTTQQEGADFGQAAEAGANMILHKPFTADDLKRALAGFGVAPC